MRKEVWVWVFLVFALVALNCVRLGGPVVSDDSFQYMSVGENIASGKGIRTSIVHFDTERSHGEIPAPITWFPAGYPAAIALLSFIGFSPLWAGFGISILSAGGLIYITAWFCSWYGLNLVATRFVLLCLIFNTWTLVYAGGVLTEALFSAVSIGAVAMIAAVSERTGKGEGETRIGWWVLCGLLVGIAPWVRYAGLFLYASLLLFLAIEVLIRRRLGLRGPIAAVVAASVPVAVLLIRNILLVGNWRGGNSIEQYSPIGAVVREFAVAVYELFFGELVRLRFGAVEVLVLLAGGVCGLLLLWAVVRHWKAFVQGVEERPSLLPVLTYVVVYLGALTYLSFFSHLGFDYRYCYPFMPLLLVLLALVATLVAEQRNDPRGFRIAVASGVVVLVCYVSLNARNTLFPWSEGSIFEDRKVAQYLSAPMDSGASLRSWIEAHVPVDGNIVASDGQATAHVLHRGTISLVGHDNSTNNWEEPQLLEVMTQFHADYLILYPDTRLTDAPAVQDESEFLSDLAEENEAVSWLELAAENPYVKVFHRRKLSGNDPVRKAQDVISN